MRKKIASIETQTLFESNKYENRMIHEFSDTLFC